MPPRETHITHRGARQTLAGPDPDYALVAACRGGSRNAFDALVLRHKDRLYTLAVRLLGDYREAEEITQETFSQAYEQIEEFHWDMTFFSWVHRICYRLCLQYLAQQKNQHGATHPDMKEQAGCGLEVSPPSLAETYQELLQWALSQLKPESREVVVLYHTEYLFYEEIAHLLELSIGTVRSRLHRGREELKDLLRPYLEKQTKRTHAQSSPPPFEP